MPGYYTERLSGDRLRRCYEIAPPRVRRYLDAEIRFVLDRLDPDDVVLEPGCGYGRVAHCLTERAGYVVGIDTSRESLLMARRLTGSGSRCEFLQMDASMLGFPDSAFDTVVCVQNGICAFGVDKGELLREALRVTRPGGHVLFSTYSERFWSDRLEWFHVQAAAGLIGAIDHGRTGNGTIVCEDGLRLGTVSSEEFRSLCVGLGVAPIITEVAGSSLFCEIVVVA